MTDTALVGGICVDIKKSMSRFADAYTVLAANAQATKIVRSLVEQRDRCHGQAVSGPMQVTAQT
ncbi:hypothetical protein OAI_18815 [Vibrio cyclitrophicus FF160]|nr:hypothetical protein [Vibrio cyclitrophicus]OEE85009.1 hypothetical protein OAI_18815 [Vibrio cyclitrophicus FF160]OEF25117.1 hypothetical protein OA9_16415 [Vibrio cyclitrophicus 1F97]PMH33132.1 hypothetical protein BCU72_15145 [Vibrio cyclitrophicus]